MATDWPALMRDDPTLRAFVEAEVARAVVGLDTAKHNAAHWRTIAGALEQKLQAAEAKLNDRREAAKATKSESEMRLRLAEPDELEMHDAGSDVRVGRLVQFQLGAVVARAALRHVTEYDDVDKLLGECGRLDELRILV